MGIEDSLGKKSTSSQEAFKVPKNWPSMHVIPHNEQELRNHLDLMREELPEMVKGTLATLESRLKRGIDINRMSDQEIIDLTSGLALLNFPIKDREQ